MSATVGGIDDDTDEMEDEVELDGLDGDNDDVDDCIADGGGGFKISLIRNDDDFFELLLLCLPFGDFVLYGADRLFDPLLIFDVY